MIGKVAPDRTNYYAYDDTTAPNQGIGHRTSMSTFVGGVNQTYARWEYDARGRMTLAGQNIGSTTHNVLTTYDSADRVTSQNYYEAGETVTYTYDAAWHPTSVCSSIVGQSCYASNASYTALDQPQQWIYGNSLIENWSYASPMQRLQQFQVGSLFTRSYTYDPVGNVASIADPQWPQTQHFSYDHRDRLTRAWTTASSALAPAMLALARHESAPSYPALTADLSDMPAAAGAPAQGGSGKALLAPLHQSGTRIKDITFEGGSLTDATTGVDSTSGTVSLETAAPLNGVYSATIPNNATGQLREDIVASADLYVSFYVRLNALPATNVRVATISNSGTTVGNLEVRPSGSTFVLRLKNGSSQVGADSAALSVGTRYRIGIHQQQGTGANAVLEVFVAAGDSAFGSPFAASSAQSFTTSATRFSFGATNSNAIDVTVDDIRLDTAVMPDPSGGSATATPTLTPTSGPTSTPTNTPTSTPTATSTPSGGGSFPATSVLDRFNRADGPLGSAWTGDTSSYAIASNQLAVTADGLVYWDASFGADQEAYVTVSTISPNASEIDLLLKGQDNGGCNLLEVWYQPSRGTVEVWTCDDTNGWQPQGSAISVTFQAGDQFGARARSDGTVDVYRNGTLLGRVTVGTNWAYRADGGAIGVWLQGTTSTHLDDFGGGATSSSPTATPTNTPTNTATPTSGATSTPTQTPVSTSTPTATETATPTSAPTATSTSTATATPTMAQSNCVTITSNDIPVTTEEGENPYGGPPYQVWKISRATAYHTWDNTMLAGGSYLAISYHTTLDDGTDWGGHHDDDFINDSIPNGVDYIAPNWATYTTIRYVAGATWSLVDCEPTSPTVTPVPTNTPTPTPAAPPAYDETYAYDALGNLTSKAGVSYTYGSSGAGTGAGPHQARTVGGASYTYDANGNLLSGGGRTYTWTADNLPASVTSGSMTETYLYDADGERVAKTVNGITTVYFQGLWEQVVGGASKLYYPFSGQVIAMRDTSTNAVTYLHGDHLGSIGAATNSSGQLISTQDFDPWGKVRGSSTVSQTALNYTGQRLDGSGLLYYHARYYDPVLARFVSADSVVPGSASGSGGGAATLGVDSSSQLAPLTVDFHEPGFVGGLNSEHAFRQHNGFWFQLDNDDQQQAKLPWGPRNPQALNRYSYVLNNPLRYVDPTGHFAAIIAGVLAGAGITVSAPVIAAIAAVVAVSALVVFLSDENNRAWLSRQIENGMTDASSFAQSLVGKVYDTSQRDKGGGWEKRRTTDGRNVRVRRLSDQDVRDRGLHEEKQGQGYRGKPAIYEDEDGNTYVGNRGGGPIEPEF